MKGVYTRGQQQERVDPTSEHRPWKIEGRTFSRQGDIPNAQLPASAFATPPPLPCRAVPVPRHRIPNHENRVASVDTFHGRRQDLGRGAHGRGEFLIGSPVRPTVDHERVELLEGCILGEDVALRLPPGAVADVVGERRRAHVEVVVSHEAQH